MASHSASPPMDRSSSRGAGCICDLCLIESSSSSRSDGSCRSCGRYVDDRPWSWTYELGPLPLHPERLAAWVRKVQDQAAELNELRTKARSGRRTSGDSRAQNLGYPEQGHRACASRLPQALSWINPSDWLGQEGALQAQASGPLELGCHSCAADIPPSAHTAAATGAGLDIPPSDPWQQAWTEHLRTSWSGPSGQPVPATWQQAWTEHLSRTLQPPNRIGAQHEPAGVQGNIVTQGMVGVDGLSHIEAMHTIWLRSRIQPAQKPHEVLEGAITESMADVRKARGDKIEAFDLERAIADSVKDDKAGRGSSGSRGRPSHPPSLSPSSSSPSSLSSLPTLGALPAASDQRPAPPLSSSQPPRHAQARVLNRALAATRSDVDRRARSLRHASPSSSRPASPEPAPSPGHPGPEPLPSIHEDSLD
jgi:hypothetical protein